MLDFAFEGGSWPGGSVGAGGRAVFLDELVDEADGDLVPDRPSIVYAGEPDYPANGLRFQTSAFRDPQGEQSFGAMKWRIAEVSPYAEVTSTSDDESFVLVAAGADWRYAKGTSEPPATWRERNFDDTRWLTGTTPIGYGEAFLATSLSDMRGGYTTVYLRREFTVSDLAAFDDLLLEVLYDDGVNVWINGTSVYRNNVASAETGYDGTAESAIDSIEYVGSLLSPVSDYLVEGTNVIAVQVLNASIGGSSDCYIDLRLTGQLQADDEPTPSEGTTRGAGKYEIEPVWESDAFTQFDSEIQIPASVVEAGPTYRVRCRMQDATGYWSHWSDPIQFEAGAPLMTALLAGLRITEVMYHPAETLGDGGFDDDEFEFIELKNVGEERLDMSGVSFVDGVTFDFQNADIVTLDPGTFVLVVRNRAAFVWRYGAEAAACIAGQYEGKLANEGERVTLVDFWDGTIAEFEYQDDGGWPTPADGAGYSLVPLDTASPETLSDGANWRASIEIGGSPGRDDL